MSKKIYLFFSIVFVLIVILIGACTPQSTASTQVPTPIQEPTSTPIQRGAGDTLRLFYWVRPTVLNPHLVGVTGSLEASRLVYEPLASYDKDGNLIPFLAQEIPSLENNSISKDGKSVTWKLKKDVLWSDGEPFTADDVLFTYKFIVNPDVGSTSANTYKTIEDVEIVDDYTVKVIFKDTNPAWMLPFVGSFGMILPEHIFADYNNSKAEKSHANNQPIGTGPYQVIDFRNEDMIIVGDDIVNTVKVIYEPNPKFREPDKPFFSKVELLGGGDANLGIRALMEDNVDFAWNLQVEQTLLEELENTGKGKLITNLGPYIERILLNHTDPNNPAPDGELSSIKMPHPFLSDKMVRKALTYSIDREAIADLYGKSGEATANNIVSPPIYRSPNTSYEFNIDKAKSLLDEAGWIDSDGDGIRDKDGIPMKVAFQTSISPLRQQTQKIVEEGLKAIGIQVELRIFDAGIFFSDDLTEPKGIYRFQADMQMYNDGNSSPDPGAYMIYWTCDQIPQQENDWAGGENIERWCNPDYDMLYEQSRTEIDIEKRKQLFIQMNDMLIEDVVMIPLVHRGTTSGVNPTIEGIDFTPWDVHVWNIKDWRRKSDE